MKKRYAKKKDELLAYRRSHYQKNIEHERERSRKYYAENKDKKKAYDKEYRVNKKTEIKTKRANYYDRNRETILKKMKRLSREQTSLG